MGRSLSLELLFPTATHETATVTTANYYVNPSSIRLLKQATKTIQLILIDRSLRASNVSIAADVTAAAVTADCQCTDVCKRSLLMRLNMFGEP